MIRENSLFCKLIYIKTSSKALFDFFMDDFHPELQTCPCCGAKGSCTVHAYYGLFFIPRVLAEYFLRLAGVGGLCERFSITPNQLYRWLALFRVQKQEWLCVLSSVHSHSQGRPRLVDSLMADALTLGAQMDKKLIDTDVILTSVSSQNLG